MKKALSVLLVLMLVMPLAAACSGGTSGGGGKNGSGGTEGGTDSTVTARPEPLDENIVELDYSGKTFTIISRPNSNETIGEEVWVEELTNDPVNDAIYNRNAYVCDVLGLGSIRQETANEIDIQDKVDIMVNSGDQTYDLVAASVYYGTPLIQRGEVYNLYDNGIDNYLDATRPWWAQYWIDQAEMGDRLYCITGAPALSLTRLMLVFYYNKDLGKSLGLEDMYGVVEEGRWTIDYLNDVIAPLYASLNGDDFRDEYDRYGLAINDFESCDTFWSSFDMAMIARDEDGWFEYDGSQQGKISAAFEKIFYLIRENPGAYNKMKSGADGHVDFATARDIFARGNAVFASIPLKFAETVALRNMQDDYGILPAPKYDQNQKEYFSYSWDQYTVFMVPKTVADPSMCGAVLEAMAYESYYSVQPTYYDLVLKGRYANDPQSRAMLDLITSHIRVNVSFLYGMEIGQPEANVLRNLVHRGNRSFATAWATQANALPAKLKLLRTAVEKLEY